MAKNKSIKGLYLELIKDRETQFFFAASDVENLESVFGVLYPENCVFLHFCTLFSYSN